MLTVEQIRAGSSHKEEMPDGVIAIRAVNEDPITPTSTSGPIIIYSSVTNPSQLGDPDVIVGSSYSSLTKQLNKLYRTGVPGTTHVLDMNEVSFSWRSDYRFRNKQFVVFTEKHFLTTRDPHLMDQAIKKVGSMPSLVDLSFLRGDHDLPFYLHKNLFTGTDLDVVGKGKGWKSRRASLSRTKNKRLHDAGVIPEFVFPIFDRYLEDSPWAMYYTSRPYYKSHPSYSFARKVNDQLNPRLSNITNFLQSFYLPPSICMKELMVYPDNKYLPTWKTDRPYIHWAKRQPRLREVMINLISVWSPYLYFFTLTEASQFLPRSNFLALFKKRHPEWPTYLPVENPTLGILNLTLLRIARDLHLPRIPGTLTPWHEIDPEVDILSHHFPWDQRPQSFEPLFKGSEK